MKLTWTFDITHGAVTYYYAMDNKTLGGHDYTAKILKGSFSGMTIRWDISGNGLVAPNATVFEVSDPDFTLADSDFFGETVTIRIYEGTTEKRVWKMAVVQTLPLYGKIKFFCEDFLQTFLQGDYPLTKKPKTIWPSADQDLDGYVLPVILGQGYVPVVSVNTGSDRYYAIGKEQDVTYTVSEVQSPHSWPSSSIWLSSEYDFNQSNLDSEAKGLQVIIHDSDGDGTADAPGVWKSGDSFLPMLAKISRSDTSSKTNPADWVAYFLEDIGVDSGDIDSTSFTAAKTAYGTMAFNGGWWEPVPRENALSNILQQCDSFLNITDKVELYQFDATGVETFTNFLEDSFRVSKISSIASDSGYVEWQKAGAPQDVLPGKTLVPANGTSNPSAETFQARFLDDSQDAQRAATLFFQKKLLQRSRISFSLAWPSIPARATIHPGQVVTVNNNLYGGSFQVIVTQIDFKKDFSVQFQGITLSSLADWGDISPAAVSIDDADSGLELPTVFSATLGVKINTVAFSTPSNRYAYLHGFDSNGVAKDINGTITYDGVAIGVPRRESLQSWTIKTSQESGGYIVFDTTLSQKFTVSGSTKSIVFARPNGDSWEYDNGAEWVTWTYAGTDIAIGTLVSEETSISSANAWGFGMDLGVLAIGLPGSADFNDGVADFLPLSPTESILVGWWTCNEQSGAYVYDSSRYDNTGELKGNTGRVIGVAGNGLTMDGTGDYVDFGLCSQFDPYVLGQAVTFCSNPVSYIVSAKLSEYSIIAAFYDETAMKAKAFVVDASDEPVVTHTVADVRSGLAVEPIGVIALSATSAVVIIKQSSSFYGYVLTISSNTITVGSANDLSSHISTFFDSCRVSSSSFATVDEHVLSGYKARVCGWTISGDTIAYAGTAQIAAPASGRAAYYAGITYLSDNYAWIFADIDNEEAADLPDDPGDPWYYQIYVTFSNGVPTLGNLLRVEPSTIGSTRGTRHQAQAVNALIPCGFFRHSTNYIIGYSRFATASKYTPFYCYPASEEAFGTAALDSGEVVISRSISDSEDTNFRKHQLLVIEDYRGIADTATPGTSPKLSAIHTFDSDTSGYLIRDELSPLPGRAVVVFYYISGTGGVCRRITGI